MEKYGVNVISITKVNEALEKKANEKATKIRMARNGENNLKYAKVYGDVESNQFLWEIWKNNKTVVSGLLEKDENGFYRELAWEE